MQDDLQRDVAAIGKIAAVPTILEVVCQSTGMGFAAVARVTKERWIACQVADRIGFGLMPGGELRIETTICNEIRESREPVAIDHVDEDGVYCGHPTPALYGFQSYVSVPILLPGGRFFGTLCAIDPRPARVKTPHVMGMFALFAELIAVHIDAHERLSASEASLLDERRTAELREQFIAVLGHDLRNPLASIEAGVKLLGREEMSDKARHITGLMEGSTRRMRGLIENVLDFARGRLGGGMLIGPKTEALLEPTLEQVIGEIRATAPEHRIEVRYALAGPVSGDHQKIAQLFCNLLANAVAHGDKAVPIRVEATTVDGVFELSVANAGEPIPEATLTQLFQPFQRGQQGSYVKGLGLGLYIAAEIARAHSGTLTAQSSQEETRFTLRMPVATGAEKSQGG